MSNSIEGIGDYIAITLLSAIFSFNKFGFEWFGFKALLCTNLIVVGYSILVYGILTIIEKFKK